MKRSIILSLLFCVMGCHRSGTWQDDPKNFERIFRVSQPKDVVVVHSWFWRSPHWTYEFEYFIQIQRNNDFKKRLLERNKLTTIETDADKKRIVRFSHERPSWFIPKPLEQYEVQIYADEPHSNFRVFIDRETSDIFLSDYQL